MSHPIFGRGKILGFNVTETFDDLPFVGEIGSQDSGGRRLTNDRVLHDDEQEADTPELNKTGVVEHGRAVDIASGGVDSHWRLKVAPALAARMSKCVRLEWMHLLIVVILRIGMFGYPSLVPAPKLV